LERTVLLGEAPAIIFDNVSLSLGDKPLFDKLSMTIEGGQCTCILGPSGCGKSTLLRMISGTTSLAYQATIRIESEAAENGKIAWMSQNDLLPPPRGNTKICATSRKSSLAFPSCQETLCGNCFQQNC
jgi:ABC-type nitrate/sulfonate/bicarbonate transport system ATPase subunit